MKRRRVSKPLRFRISLVELLPVLCCYLPVQQSTSSVANAFSILTSHRYHAKIRENYILRRNLASTSSGESSSFSSSEEHIPFDDFSTTTADDLDLIRFQRRRQQLESQKILPPHPSLEAKQVITAVLHELRYSDPYFDFDPLQSRPHKGVYTLWQTCTPQWQQVLATMVGLNATNTTTTSEALENDSYYDSQEKQTRNIIVSALGRFLARPNQQFAILLGRENADYWIDFPTDVVEWGEDECWVECRLRLDQTNELLVVLGWTLTRQQTIVVTNGNNNNPEENAKHNNDFSKDISNSWKIDALDWQDFRDAYRPGIGREEWERICG